MVIINTCSYTLNLHMHTHACTQCHTHIYTHMHTPSPCIDLAYTSAMQSGGYGNKTAGQLVMDRYNTLAMAKEEAAQKHQMQLQEVGLNA